MRGLWVRANGGCQEVLIDGLEDLQKLVGGLVEGVVIVAEEDTKMAGLAMFSMYWNEDGKAIDGARVNWSATRMMQYFKVIPQDDFIVGDTVVLGPPTPDGDEQSLSDLAATFVKDCVQSVDAMVQQAMDAEFDRIVKRETGGSNGKKKKRRKRD